jgi:hypothetical protein
MMAPESQMPKLGRVDALNHIPNRAETLREMREGHE